MVFRVRSSLQMAWSRMVGTLLLQRGTEMTLASLAAGASNAAISVRRRFCEVRADLAMQSTKGAGGAGRGNRIVDRSALAENCLSWGSFVPWGILIRTETRAKECLHWESQYQLSGPSGRFGAHAS